MMADVPIASGVPQIILNPAHRQRAVDQLLCNRNDNGGSGQLQNQSSLVEDFADALHILRMGSRHAGQYHQMIHKKAGADSHQRTEKQLQRLLFFRVSICSFSLAFLSLLQPPGAPGPSYTSAA